MIQNRISLSKKCKTVNQLKQIHAHLIKSVQSENPHSVGPLLSAAAISHNTTFFSYACSIFNHLYNRNTFIYNTMIRAHVQANSSFQAISCYLDMLNYGLTANNYTFPPLIKACTVSFHSVNDNWGRLVHAHVVKFGFSGDPYVVSAFIEYYSLIRDMGVARLLFDKMCVRDVVVWTAMIDGYGKIGDVENARLLFDEMPERNVISWSAIMASYSHASDYKEVLSLFKKMQEMGVNPNESVLASVLTACANLGALTQGMWVHSYVKRRKFGSNLKIATALIDMYSKCGCLDLALSVFEGIAAKDAGSWNAMISCFSMNGYAKQALELFYKMVIYGTKPTNTTFIAVLAACTHANLVNVGLKLFEKMGSFYRVEPQFEHYASVVDLLARAGMLEEAEKFIDEKMGGLKGGDANVWGALLCACRSYGKYEIANRVWKKLAKMGVSDPGIRVLSYNIYKEAGHEKEAKRVRRSLTQVGTKKKPGCSVIEVDGIVVEFLAGDLSHQRAGELCKVINFLFNIAKLEDTPHSELTENIVSF